MDFLHLGLGRARRAVVTIVALAAVTVSAQACGDDDAAGSADPATACDTMCKGGGFSSSRVDAHSHETNCFCLGTGTVTAASCTDMCKSTGKPGKVFGSGAGATANACQCQ